MEKIKTPVEMLEFDGHYYPSEYCTTTNPATTPGGKSVVDDVDVPCSCDCDKDCDKCQIQAVLDDYAKLTGQAK